MQGAPLILTLRLDDISQALFDKQRQANFPAERNFLSAHLTLFHQLPAGELAIEDAVEKVCDCYKPVLLEVTGVKNVGNGVAYTISSLTLQEIHRHLQQEWKNRLIPQDQHKLWPHITIQNKVSPERAASLIQELADSFKPFAITGLGFNLYEYQGGPWKFIDYFALTGRADATS